MVPGDLRLDLPGDFLLLCIHSLDSVLCSHLRDLPVRGVPTLVALQQPLLPEQDHQYTEHYLVIVLMPPVYCITSTLSFLSVVSH